MKRIGLFSLSIMFAALLALTLPAACPAKGHGHAKKDAKAILLVTFGTSVPRAQKVFAKVERAYKKAFPGVEVRWAYTSALVRKIVARKQGKKWLSPEEALAKLMAEGYSQVAVQSLHVIPGWEYHDLVRVVHGFKSMTHDFRPLAGYPLCATVEDLQAVVKALLNNLPAKRRKNEAVVFMGHGTSHPAGTVYAALAYLLQKHDPLLFMGTVEGYPTLADVIAGLKARGVKKAYLLPFMTVAGDHATNDMAGDEPDSWKNQMAKNGIEAVPVLRSVSEIPAVVDIFINHTKACYGHFK